MQKNHGELICGYEHKINPENFVCSIPWKMAFALSTVRRVNTLPRSTPGIGIALAYTTNDEFARVSSEPYPSYHF